MDASAFIILILCFAGISLQFPQSDLQNLDVANESNRNDTNNAKVTMSCATARGVPGTCVDRQFCDYTTPAIDLTLYAPRGYKKQCAEKETCCPYSYQIREEANKETWEDKDFSFDDKK